ncbi:MAG TPA: ABC transporter permease [Candidatus Limnocylindrales bacterium]|nr:ABC transporter permease [Candidatus Limnocylindrales bacterium]HEU4919626.1 ABC transporter permease [Candidatus Limnocylindrales bacterium]
MDALFEIPVIGFILQLIAYLIEALATTGLAPQTLALATPIALGAMCGVMNERSGIVNIGIEGMMLTSAFVGFMAALVVHESGPPATPSAVFGITPALLVGVAAAIVAGMAVSLLHAWMSISVRADQIISGTVINIIALGLTSYVNRLVSAGGSAGNLKPFDPPDALVDLPLVGWLFKMFLAVGPISMSVIVIVIVLQILLFRSRWGLRTRAVGEHPRAADTVGINVIALRYRNVVLGGIFAGLAGAWLTLEYNATFQNGMSANRGFIALAAVIFGRWTPIGAFGGALLFMFSEALGIAIRSNPPEGALGDALSGIQTSFPSLYNNVFGALPYLLTLIILAGVVGRSIAPAAVGKPYVKESTT